MAASPETTRLLLSSPVTVTPGGRLVLSTCSVPFSTVRVVTTGLPVDPMLTPLIVLLAFSLLTFSVSNSVGGVDRVGGCSGGGGVINRFNWSRRPRCCSGYW